MAAETIDARATRFWRYGIWAFAFIAGYGGAVVLNIGLFFICGDKACAGTFWSYLPGSLAIVVACWVVRYRGSRTKAALAGVGVTLALALSTAPLRAQDPLSWSISQFPGDFLIVGWLLVPIRAASLVLALPYSVFLLVPVAFGAVTAAILRSASQPSPLALRVRAITAGLLLLAALLAEIITTPSVWSPLTHRRIAAFVLTREPELSAVLYQGWAQKGMHFTANPDLRPIAVLDERVFADWRRIDCTPDDAIWVDPTGTVLAWAYSVPHSSVLRQTIQAYVYGSLTDLDRATWRHRYRRTASGERLVDAIRNGGSTSSDRRRDG
jgi:hypothetical protein